MIRQINANQWRSHLSEVSKSLANRKFSIEIIGMDVGSQVEVDSSVFTGICYDPKDNIVEVYAKDLEHYIRSPKEIYLSAQQGEIDSIEVVEESNRRQIISFEKQILLREGK